MKIEMSLRMQTRIAPQMVLSGQLLRASIVELEQTLVAELRENPALELAREAGRSEENSSAPLYSGAQQHYGNLEEEQFALLRAELSTVETLQNQLALLVDPADQNAAIALLYELDEHGYLRSSREELAESLSMSLEQVERIIAILHQLEPPGIGARNLRECLLLQCSYLIEQEKLRDPRQAEDCLAARHLLDAAWEEFTRQQLGRAARKLGMELQQVNRAADFISRCLYPYPLNLLLGCSSPGMIVSRPDLIIHRRSSAQKRPVFQLEIAAETAWELRLADTFSNLLRSEERKNTLLSVEEQEWLNEQVQRARAFIAALEQRWFTLRRIAEFVLSYQALFLEHGTRCLRPLTRAQVAEALDLHESTVSRAVSDKIVQLPGGRLVPFSDLFDSSLPVKAAIRKMLAQAGGAISDREIAERLQKEGVEVARRTVAKYREQLHIPNSRERAAA